MANPDILCLGELLIDFVSLDPDTPISDSSGFRKAPGGAPANVAVGVCRLGLRGGFIGKVGGDPFGVFLRQTLEVEGVDTAMLVSDPDARTTLAFLGQRSDGSRDIMFYRNPGADMLLRADEIDPAGFAGAAFFHFGSISLGCEPVRSATLRAIEIARAGGVHISYDPNLRPSLWPDMETARHEITAAFPLADVVKISEEEYGAILGVDTPEACAARILSMGPRLVVVTLGGKGCYYSDGTRDGYLPSYPDVKVVETTGAGDTFVAATLTGLAKRLQAGDPKAFAADDGLVRILTQANAAGSLACTKLGAIPSMPTAAEVEAFLAAH